MSKYSPTKKRIGELMLHCASVNDMSAERWLSLVTQDEKSWLLDTHEGQQTCHRDPLNAHKVIDLLSDGTPQLHQQLSEAFSEGTVQSMRTSTENPVQRFTGSVKGSVDSGSYMIETDKGEFYNVSQLKHRLKPLYNIEGFDELFSETLVDIGVCPSIQFISTARKKTLTTKLKVLAKKLLDKRTEEI